MAQEWPFQPNQEKPKKKPAVIRYTEAKESWSNPDQYLTIGDNFRDAMETEIGSFVSQINFSGLTEYINQSEAKIANLPEKDRLGLIHALYSPIYSNLKSYLTEVPPLRLREHSNAEQIADANLDRLNFFIDIVGSYVKRKKDKTLGFDPEKIQSPYTNPYDKFIDSGAHLINLYLGAFPEKTRGKTNIDKAIDAYLSLAEEGGKDTKYINLSGSLGKLFREKKEYVSERILSILSQSHYREKHKQFLVILLSDTIGAEETRIRLSELIYEESSKGEQKDQNKIDSLEHARALITPNHEKISTERINELYGDKVKFEGYGLNEKMTPQEVPLLKSLIKKDGKVLDMGCGPGRLLLALQENGYDISGYDYTARHVKLIKKQSPKAKVFKGDWKNNALKDGSFDTAYSLGRNILHEYSLPDQVQTFREAQRTLKPQGHFIIDIPDRDKGEYQQRVRDYADAMYEFGVKNYRYGAIYDSPDGKHFSTRYAYSDKDIRNLAELSGFRIIEVQRKPLPTGKDDENLYYVLKKKTKIKDMRGNWYTLLEYEERALEIAQEVASKGGSFEEFLGNMPGDISLSGGGQAQEIWQAAKDPSGTQ
jgi:SAM-dependent methyltransferase